MVSFPRSGQQPRHLLERASELVERPVLLSEEFHLVVPRVVRLRRLHPVAEAHEQAVQAADLGAELGLLSRRILHATDVIDNLRRRLDNADNGQRS